jgi:hypothetical protein
MQKDFMSMAQGQQAPAAPQDELSVVVENITQMAQQAGMFGEADPTKLEQQIQELAQLMVDNDQEGVRTNKLFQVLMQMLAEAEKMQEQQGQPTGGQVPQQGAAPKDFASMMPPTPGGGMGGR